jgi:ArsR family transcriptional regulator
MVKAHINQDSIKRDKTAKVLKVLGDPNRIKIIELLNQGEMCQCDIIPLIKQSQPTMSRHLSLLEEHGILISHKDGVKMIYSIADPNVSQIIELAASLN